MKKNYIKPEINFESFGVSENFAASIGTCDVRANHQMNDCGVFDAGRVIFTNEIPGCTFPVRDGELGQCYHLFENNVFIS